MLSPQAHPHHPANPAIEKVTQKWTNLPQTASESQVCSLFVEPLLDALGFDSEEWVQQFPVGGVKKVDYAVRKNNFLVNKFGIEPKNPYLLIEVKKPAINLAEGTPAYKNAKQQITGYLLAPRCQTGKWGLITNGNHIQLFRRHGKVVFPATANYLIQRDNLAQIIHHIKHLIDNPPQALSICTYNDKGGVGKTTTAVNLAAVLATLNKKVLVVDFDPQQGDLTAALGKKEGNKKLSDCLIDHKTPVKDTIQTFTINLAKNRIKFNFDLIASDLGLETFMSPDQRAKIQGDFQRLKKLIEPLSNEYDYIIFDCPTNWFFFSQSCVYASDVVLIPVQHDNFASLKNARKVIEQYIPEIQKKKGDGSPVALPVFSNNHSPTKASIKRMHEEINLLLKLKPELEPYFFPNLDTHGHPIKQIRSLPQFAIIASAGFSRLPAALKHKKAYEYYKNLVQEYFL